MSDPNVPVSALAEITPSDLPFGLAQRPADTFYASGETDRPSDRRIVAVVLGCRTEIKAGDRDFSGPMNFHEIAIMRRFLDARGGGAIRVSSGWPAGLPRFRALTQSDLTEECRRMARHYVVIRQPGQPPSMVFNDFFGQEPSVQLVRLHKLLADQFALWKTFMVDARTRVPKSLTVTDKNVMEAMAMDYLYEREIEEIVALADPGKKGLESIELPTFDVGAPAAAPAAPAASKTLSLDELGKGDLVGDVPDATDKLLDALGKRGISQSDALKIAALAEDKGGIDKISNEELAKIVGKEKVKATREAAV